MSPQCGARLCRPHPEERACSNGSAKSNERASRRMRTAWVFMPRDASQRSLGRVLIKRAAIARLHCRATIRILAALRRLIQSFGLAGQPRLALPPGVIEPVCPEPGIGRRIVEPGQRGYINPRSPQQALFGASSTHAVVSAPPKGRRRRACANPTHRKEPHSAAAFG